MHSAKITDWYLEGALGQRKSVVIPLIALQFNIGRNVDCHLSLASPEISRKHAVIDCKGNDIIITDCGSTNGTYVNRQRIIQPTPIREGDILHFGSIEFRVGKTQRDIGQKPENFDETQLALMQYPDQQLPEQFVACEKEFLELLDNRSIFSVRQPIVDANSNQITAYEILGRGNHPKLPRAPYPLFALAEKLGHAEQLSRMFRYIGIQNALNSADNYPMLFFNLHPQEMFKKELITSLEQIRAIAPQVPIVLEVHETAVTHIDEMKKLMKTLLRLNYKLAYDDFGAGHARLNELVEVPPDFLKFDISLIHNIDKSPKKQNLVSALVRMCNNLGIETLAEGVEYPQEAVVCKQIGFTHMQGFFYGRPNPM